MYAQLKFLFKVFNSYIPKNSCIELPFVLLDSCMKLNSISLDHQFSSRWCLRALKSLYMRSTPSPRSFSNVAFETVPMSMGDDGPHSSFPGRLSSTSSSMPLSSRQLMVRCPWLCAHRYCPQPLISLHSSMSRAPHPPVYLLSHFSSQGHVQGSTPASLPAPSFPFTAACPAQHTRTSFQRRMSAWASSSTFCNKLIEFMTMMACGLTDAS